MGRLCTRAFDPFDTDQPDFGSIQSDPGSPPGRIKNSGWFVAGRWDTIDVFPGTIRTNPTFAAYYHRGDRKDIIAAGNHTVQPVI